MVPFNHANFTLSTEPYNNGFSIKFPNEYVVSVRWGNMNYCSNIRSEGCTLGSQTAEVAIFDPNNNIVGDVYGSVTPSMLLGLMNEAAKEIK